jgi:glycerol-3-phosphate dehydrogenase
MLREKTKSSLKTMQFDLLIIGGGASGAGAALDAASRGLSVALIERDDWATGTSSRSTKLLHGGVRYLEQAFLNFDFAQLKQVKHGLQERKTVIAAAPFLARPLALVTPVMSWWQAFYLTLGLKIYGLIAGRKDTMPAAQWLNRRQALQAIPNLHPEIKGAVKYYDGQFDDARYVLLLVNAARQMGAVCLNYTGFSAFGKSSSGLIHSAHVLDAMTQERYEIKAKQVLNCCGPFSDALRLAANAELQPRLKQSKGVHICLPLPAGMTDALMIPKTKDGRVIFAIPFQDVLMLGTTDTPYRQIDAEPMTDAEELAYLLETVNPYLSRPLLAGQVQAAFGGLRPLIQASDRSSTKQLLRDHAVELDETSGLVSLLGGKWTTYRLMAQDAVDEICRRRNTPDLVCKTEKMLLPGTEGYLADTYKQLQASYADFIGKDMAKALCQRYGMDAYDVVELCKEDATWSEEICDGALAIQAEVIWQLRNEMVCTIRDVLARRLRLESTNFHQAYAAAPIVGRLMAWELGWKEQEEAEHITAYQAFLQRLAAPLSIELATT